MIQPSDGHNQYQEICSVISDRSGNAFNNAFEFSGLLRHIIILVLGALVYESNHTSDVWRKQGTSHRPCFQGRSERQESDSAVFRPSVHENPEIDNVAKEARKLKRIVEGVAGPIGDH